MQPQPAIEVRSHKKCPSQEMCKNIDGRPLARAMPKKKLDANPSLQVDGNTGEPHCCVAD
jgi:hypothetical protein